MTHSGGKPHSVGDQGQRYEVTCRGIAGDDTESIFGWASTLAAAASMVKSIELHPSMHSPEVRDRWSAEPTESMVPLDVVKAGDVR